VTTLKAKVRLGAPVRLLSLVKALDEITRVAFIKLLMGFDKLVNSNDGKR
jgi:hypothetical protein